MRISIDQKLTKTLLYPLILLGLNFRKPYEIFVKKVHVAVGNYANLSNDELLSKVLDARQQMYLMGFDDKQLVNAFALVVIASRRKLGMSPYDTQLMAARMMLDGKLVEMATGEGKTLAMGLAAAVAAFAGKPVYVITSNDYLVKRDAHLLKPLFDWLNLSLGMVFSNMPESERRSSYQAQITYCTAKELVFDYLRDQMRMQEIRSELHLRFAQLAERAPVPLLNGLHVALIDEADSILLDEATVPLILSESTQDNQQLNDLGQIFEFARNLTHQDFELYPQSFNCSLTETGLQKLTNRALDFNGHRSNLFYWEGLVKTALTGLHLYHRDLHYLIEGKGIKVIDQQTGRVAEGRVWSYGLHQILEMKEGLPLTNGMATKAQTSYQRFFSKFALLGGMSGTLKEARTELYSSYGLKMITVPLHRPSRRMDTVPRLFSNSEQMWDFACMQIKRLHDEGRPILVGTDSVGDSESLSYKLKAMNLPHQVLNARQNAIEADVIAKAGQVGKITVSTNIAGRGTDIRLTSEASALGGLHVLSCQHNLSRRIDRQLLGRAGRQGDPGSSERLFNLEGYPIYEGFKFNILSSIGLEGKCTPAFLIKLLFNLPKWLNEYQLSSQRNALLKHLNAQDEHNTTVKIVD